VSNRELLLAVIVVAMITDKWAPKIGEDAFASLLVVGFIGYVVWTAVAYNRGDLVFWWQKKDG
jgi:hypothetical protein